MSKMVLVLCFFLISLSTFASDKIGVGAMVGNPTGLSVKKWLGGNKAVDGGFGMGLGRKAHVSIHSDYLLHKPAVLYFNEVYELDLYYGIGARLRFADEMSLGARVPVGLVHQFKENPFDVFGEVAPVVDFLGRTGVDLNLAIGGRFFF